MKLQVSSRLAIFAILELARDGGQQMSVAQIGEKFGVSSHHLAKVMHTLGKANLVRSTRGAGGGYVFCGNIKRTTLLDIILLFEEPIANVDRVVHAVSVENALDQVLYEIDDIAKATLGSITISTMLKQLMVQKSRLKN